MIRVGYPQNTMPEYLRCFPEEVELIALPEQPSEEVAIDVWIPDPIGARALRVAPFLRGVKLVLAQTAGTEWVPQAVGPEVTICNARGAHNIATAEWTVGAIFAMLKYFPFYLDVQQSGGWKRRFEACAQYANFSGDERRLVPPVLLEELTGKKVLLVGHGAIGKEIERMLAPFHVALTRMARTARSEPKVEPVSELDRLLPEAEVIILILPLTADSHHMINAERLAKMRRGALIINAARGPIIDTDALVAALNEGRIRAALDVTDPEPLPDSHPLWKCPNLLLTPHVAGSVPQAGPRALAVVADELRRYIKGEALENVVRKGI